MNCLSGCPFENDKPPRSKDLRGISGAGGIRTHTPSRAPVFETGAIPIMRRRRIPNDPPLMRAGRVVAFSYGARGIRTPKPFRALAFEASAIPFCQRSKQQGAGAAGYRETHALRRFFKVVVEEFELVQCPEKPRRTGPLGGYLIGAPGFEPGTSATRTQRSTGLSHAPNTTGTT